MSEKLLKKILAAALLVLLAVFSFLFIGDRASDPAAHSATISVIDDKTEDVLRLYLDGRAFGVYVPEDGALGLCRRVSRTQLPELPAHAVAWCEADGRWMPSEGGMCRHTPRGRELAVPWRTDAPMTLPAAPEKLRPLRLEGAYYLVRE